ncbi:hypothetical protein ACFE04_017320 [Oxalis oulophora]
MGLRKIEAEEEFDAPAEKFYEIWRKRPHHMPDIAPDHIQGVEVHEGDYETHGSIKSWNYTCEGKPGVFKEKIHFDDENLKITLVGVGGDVFEHYKKYDCIFHFIPKGNGTLAKIIIEYEKISDDMPDPINYFNVNVAFIKDSATHLTKA